MTSYDEGMPDPYRQPHPLPVERRRFPTHYVVAAALASLIVSMLVVHRVRAKPHCEIVDCATGEVIDDGCVNGVCAACVNACGQFD